MSLIDNEVALVSMARVNSEIVKEYLHTIHINKIHNVVKFMSQTSNEYLTTLGVKDRLKIIIWAKKFIEKHNLLERVSSRTKQMEEEVKKFKDKCEPLYDKGIPIFWDSNGKLLLKEERDTMLTQARMDHSKFEDMDKNLKGEVVVDNLSDDFDILAQIKMIKENSPAISISSCVELQVMVREMMEYKAPS